MSFHYLDNAATTQVSEAAINAAVDVMRVNYGNPSSVHKMGVAAEQILRSARESIAKALVCETDNIVFTSGGTEANNLALRQILLMRKKLGGHIITTSVEHSSVSKTLKQMEQQGCEVSYLRALPGGGISLDELESLIRPDTSMLAMMLVCNETGVRLPVEDAVRVFKRKNPNGFAHIDAVQCFLKERFTPASLGADLLSVSSHKVHGPKGAGALYVRSGVNIIPSITGGGHERGLRAGTEPLPAIAGFGIAVNEGLMSFDADRQTINSLMEHLDLGLKSNNRVQLIASGRTIAAFSVPKYPSEVTVRMLADRDIIISSGAACGRGKPSHVLTAMRLDPKLISSAVRVSVSHTNAAEDVDALLTALNDIA